MDLSVRLHWKDIYPAVGNTAVDDDDVGFNMQASRPPNYLQIMRSAQNNTF